MRLSFQLMEGLLPGPLIASDPDESQLFCVKYILSDLGHGLNFGQVGAIVGTWGLDPDKLKLDSQPHQFTS